MSATEQQQLALGLAVVEVKLQAMQDRNDERHQALLDALERIEASVTPLSSRIGELEKARAGVLAVAAAVSAIVPALVWVLGKLVGE
jgi:hypothetical protein